MSDSHFKRAVILLTEHNEEGSVGFILNKPVDLELRDATLEFEGLHSMLYYGGPVQLNSLHFLHTLGNRLPGSMPITQDICWGGNVEELKNLVRQDEELAQACRFFVGYSGWSPQQLAEELAQKTWIVSPVTQQNYPLLFEDNTGELWRQVLRTMGQEYAIIANFPEDPRMN